jgi:tetratricopeptide (TPR) repeat protein
MLASGDSSKLYLKRAGIGYSYNLQPKQAIVYLLEAYKSDSTDYETCSFLGQCYNRINDMKNSVFFYKKAIKIVLPLNIQLGYTYSLCAESQKSNGANKDAIDSYLKSYSINKEPGILLSIANIYDEKLSDKKNAINYYQNFLDKVNNSKMNFTPEYILNVKRRMEYLKIDPVR